MTIIKLNTHTPKTLLKKTKQSGTIVSSRRKTKVIKMQNTVLPKEIQQLIKDFYTVKSPLALVKLLEEKINQIKGLEKIGLTSFKFGDFKIDSMITQFANKIAEQIKLAKNMQLSTAPEIVKHVKSDIGESLLISKVEGLKKANLISATEMEKLSNNAKKLLLEDLEKLKKNGYILPGIKNKENILLDGNTGLPKLINFDTLRKATSPTEINDIMNSVKSL